VRPLPKSPASLKYREHELQRFVVETLRLYGVPNLIYFHPANEGKRSERTGNFLKRMGMLSGVADIVVILPGAAAKFLELKVPGSQTSMAQIAFAAACGANGCDYALARSPEEAAAILHEWGALRVNPLASRRAAA
jgi:hypothetical protein